jgi:HSP20 family molecular chaperone IbpA
MTSKKTKKLEEQGEKSNKPEENQPEASEGVVENILRGLSDIIPGVGGLMKGLKKSEAFRERVREVEEEIEARLRGTLRRNDECRMQNDERIRKSVHHSSFIVHHSGTVKREKEITVDVFDEEDYMRVIAELPGVEEKDIKVDVTGDTLIISADTLSRQYHRAVKLPCQPRAILTTTYRNGVLEVRLEKGSGEEERRKE